MSNLMLSSHVGGQAQKSKPAHQVWVPLLQGLLKRLENFFWYWRYALDDWMVHSDVVQTL